MSIALHLMDDMKVLKTVNVGTEDGSISTAFDALMDYIVHEVSGCNEVDVFTQNLILREVNSHRRNLPADKDEVLKFSVNSYNIIYHETF